MPISYDECCKVVRKLTNDKSPGSDGLPSEFYKAHWSTIGPLVFDALSFSVGNGKLSISQRHAQLRLIHKKDDREILENWRPISLLNTDYKILAFILSSRLQPILGRIINHDQTAYLKKRFIGQNVRLTYDVIDYANTENIPGAILFLDFRKAFDTIEWNFMFKTLEKFNFGTTFVNFTKTLYNACQSSVLNHGWVSEPLSLKRGIRQGCPVSALLFLLVAEIMATKIRSDQEINGIKITNKKWSKEIRISQVADDTTIFVSNKQSIERVIQIVEKYSSVAGLTLNLNKTQGLWIGANKNNDQYGTIIWPKTPIKSLGTYFSNNYINAIKLALNEKNNFNRTYFKQMDA